MLIPIQSSQELGLLVRAVRKSQKLRMDDAGAAAGVGHVFVRDVERGKETIQLGRALKLLAELGIALHADVPKSAAPAYEALKLTGVKPLPPRHRKPGPTK